MRPTVLRRAFSRAVSSLAALDFDLGRRSRHVLLLRLIGLRLTLQKLAPLQGLGFTQHVLGVLLLVGRFLLAGGDLFALQRQRIGRLLFFEGERVGLLLSVELSRIPGIAGALETADRLLRAGDHRYGL